MSFERLETTIRKEDIETCMIHISHKQQLFALKDRNKIFNQIQRERIIENLSALKRKILYNYSSHAYEKVPENSSLIFYAKGSDKNVGNYHPNTLSTNILRVNPLH